LTAVFGSDFYLTRKKSATKCELKTRIFLFGRCFEFDALRVKENLARNAFGHDFCLQGRARTIASLEQLLRHARYKNRSPTGTSGLETPQNLPLNSAGC
jgi:hypothetical protein